MVSSAGQFLPGFITSLFSPSVLSIQTAQVVFHRTIAVHFDRAGHCPADRPSMFSAPTYPAAALKQRIALVHPLAQATGLASI